MLHIGSFALIESTEFVHYQISADKSLQNVEHDGIRKC